MNSTLEQQYGLLTTRIDLLIRSTKELDQYQAKAPLSEAQFNTIIANTIRKK